MQDYSVFNDNDLIKAIKFDDSNAFNELYDRYAEGLVSFIFKKLEDLEESKDVVQEIFVTIWEDRENLLEINSVANYLYKVAVNKSLNIFRKQRVTQAYINSLANFIERNPTLHLDDSNEIEREKILTNALGQLPEKMRAIFELRYYHGLSNEQVAEQLGISIHTVTTQMKRALKRIRSLIGLLLFLLVISYL